MRFAGIEGLPPPTPTGSPVASRVVPHGPGIPVPHFISVEPGIEPPRMVEALIAANLVPQEDASLLARFGVRVTLRNVARLGEHDWLGATDVQQGADGRWAPRSISVAADPEAGQPVGHTVLHEVGHAISVIRHQDRSEEAAEAYAEDREAEYGAFVAEHGAAGGSGETAAPAPPVAPPAPTGSLPPSPAPSPAEPAHHASSWAVGAAVVALLGLALLV